MRCRYFLILSLCVVIFANAQTFDEKYAALRQAIDTIKIDSATFAEVYGSQIDEIFMDLKQINQAIRAQNDSLTNELLKNNAHVNELISKNRMFFYLIIVTALLTLVLITLLIVSLIRGSGWKKKFHQNLTEYEVIQNELQKLKQTTSQEKEAYELQIEKINSDKEKLVATAQRLQEDVNNKKLENEKLKEQIHLLEQKISDLQTTLMQEQAKCEELSAHVNDLLELKNEKETTIEQLKAEIRQMNENSLNYSTTIQQLEEQIAFLKQENNELLQRAVKAAETEEKVNAELKKFIAELQAMLPLPRNG